MSKLNVIICSDVGHHGDKLYIYSKKAGDKKGNISVVNFPAAAVVADNTKLNQDIKFGGRNPNGCSVSYKETIDSDTYFLGGVAITKLDPGKVRKLSDKFDEKDRAFLSLGESRFESSCCDALIRSTIAYVLHSFVSKGVVDKLSDITVSCIGFALPHQLIYETTEDHNRAVEHVTNLFKTASSCYIAFEGDNFEKINFIPKSSVSDTIIDDNSIVIDDSMIIPESQCVCLLYQALLNVDGTAREFTDKNGDVHTLENDPSYFNNSIILDIGKRTCQGLQIIDMTTFSEIVELEPRAFSMYNVDCKVATEMNEFYGFKEGTGFYLKGEDIDNILTGKLDCHMDKKTGNMIYSLDDEEFNITEARIRNVKLLCEEMVGILADIDDGVWLRRIKFIFVAGGSAKLFYPAINSLVLDRYKAKEGRIILCTEDYSDGESDTVFAVVGGLFRMLTAEFSELIS